jgi:serine/threonine-protein kinase HipA
MEQVAQLIESHCTFPAVEKMKLFRLTIFSYLIGNEDMHLKNFSIITKDNVTRLSPAYDLINTTIILSRVKEELALALNGRKNNLRVSDFVDYFGGKRLQLPSRVINEVLSGFIGVRHVWDDLISRSFLSQPTQERYRQLVKERFAKMFPQVV